MNVEADILSPDSTQKLDDYKLIVVPALYAASDAEIARLNDYAKRGGHLLYTFKSGFSDENTKVRYAAQPGAIAEAAGVTYQEFTIPVGVTLAGNPFGVSDADNAPRWWMEMLKPDDRRGGGALSASVMAGCRRDDPQPLGQRRGQLRRLHAERRAGREDRRRRGHACRCRAIGCGRAIPADRARRHVEERPHGPLRAQLLGSATAHGGSRCRH